MMRYVVALLSVLNLTQARELAAGSAVYVEDLKNGAESRIVGGWEAVPGQIPHYTSLRMVNQNGAVGSCGGSLISDQWVLTAGHCLDSRYSFVIRFGVTDIERPSQIQETNRRFMHPNYLEFYPFVQTDDIGLLQLTTPVTISELVKPIRLQSSEQRNHAYSGVVLTASGFGLTDDAVNGGVAPDMLRWVMLRGITNEECLEWYGGSNIIQPETICAQYYNHTSQSTCRGDSGGPLTFVDEDGELTQVGISGFVHVSGCNNEVPSGYIRPGHYHAWITDVTKLQLDWSHQPNNNDQLITNNIIS